MARTICVVLVTALLQQGGSARQPRSAAVDIDLFLRTTALDDSVAEAAFATIAGAWNNRYAALLVDVVDPMRRTSLGTPDT